jgi:ubiquinone biosynthesis protein
MFSFLRLVKIIFVFIPVALPIAKDIRNEECTKSTAVKFRKALQKLGPTFIKLGQMLSLRYDFIPKGYCEELQKLLDNGEVIKFKTYIKLIESGLKIKLSDVFRNIDIDPVGCASLAQVHTGYLNDGTKVAVKVLRPGVKRIVKRDITNLRLLSRFLSLNTFFRKINIRNFIDEFERYTLKELNLKTEGQNCDTFRENFKNNKDVKIPKVYWEGTSKKVLTMEFIEGVSVKEFIKIFSYSKKSTETIRGIRISKKRIAEVVTQALFKQIFKHGFFHGDPHPANMIITYDNRFAFVDFGIVGTFSEAQISMLTEFVIAVADGDYEKAIKFMIALDQIEGVENFQELRKSVEKIISTWRKTKISRFSVTRGILQLINQGTMSGIDWPVEMFLFIKLIVTLDGLTQRIYPEYNIFDKFGPHLVESKKKNLLRKITTKKIVAKLEDVVKLISEIPETAREILTQLKEGQFQVMNKTDPKNLAFKDKTLRIIVLLVLCLAFFGAIMFVVSTDTNYVIYKSIDVLKILVTSNIVLIVVIFLQLFQD